jgi:hypothetical protein
MRLSHRSIRSLPWYLLPPLNVMSSTLIYPHVLYPYPHVQYPYSHLQRMRLSKRSIRSFPQCLLPHSIKPARTHAGAHATARVRTEAQTKTIGAGKDTHASAHSYTPMRTGTHARTHAHSPDAHVGAVDEACGVSRIRRARCIIGVRLHPSPCRRACTAACRRRLPPRRRRWPSGAR